MYIAVHSLRISAFCCWAHLGHHHHFVTLVKNNLWLATQLPHIPHLLSQSSFFNCISVWKVYMGTLFFSTLTSS
jgi:hypothetical protein